MSSWWPSPAEWSAILLSLKVALWCVVFMTVPGVLAGWILARFNFRGKTLLDGILHLPLVLPPVVVGYLLLILLGRRGAIGSFLHETLGIEIAFTMWAAVLASAVMGFPLLTRSVRLAMELADVRLEEAARTLGATPLRTFFTITIPAALPGIITGVLLAFARSLGEFGATITFAGNIADVTRTLPLALFTYTQSAGGEGPAMRLVIVSILLSLAALMVSEVFARRVRRRLGDEHA